MNIKKFWNKKPEEMTFEQLERILLTTDGKGLKVKLEVLDELIKRVKTPIG